jgi:GTP-binding protein
MIPIVKPPYHQCRYLRSAHGIEQLPDDSTIEIAVAGRSNAGKSSLINAVTGQRALARVSRTPGRTQAINLFSVGEGRYLVDLPGYGYAKVPDKVRRHWDRILEQYLRTRRPLKGLFLIMDSRRPLQQLDWQLIEWAAGAGLHQHMILTKADKLSRGAANRTLHETAATLEQRGIEATLQLFSILKKDGLEDARGVLDEWFEFDEGD